MIYADEVGLWAALLPFEDELYPIPNHDVRAPSAKAGALFAQMVEQEHARQARSTTGVGVGVPRAPPGGDRVGAGRQAGQAPAPKRKTKDSGPDLMALLEQSVAKKKSPAGGKKKAKSGGVTSDAIQDELLMRREAVRHALQDYRRALEEAIAEANGQAPGYETSLIEVAAALRVLWMEST